MYRTLLALVVLVAIPATAQAGAPPDTVIDFNTLANNEMVENQYAGAGVIFGQTSKFSLPRPPGRTCNQGQTLQGRTGGIGGTTSLRMDCAGGLGEIDKNRQFSAVFEFTTERREVRFDLTQRTTGGSPVVAKIRAYNASLALLGSEQSINVGGGTTPASVIRATPEVAYVVIYGELSVNDTTAGDVLIDNISATNEEVNNSPPPKYRLALEAPTIGVFEGGRAEATLTVRRFNGSNGPVNLTSSLPGGIRSVEFDPPNPASSQPVKIKIRGDNPASGERQLTISASGGGVDAGTNVGTPLIQTVNLLPAVVQGGVSSEPIVAGCGPQRFGTGIQVRGELMATIDFTATSVGGQMGVSAVPNRQFVLGAGTYSYDLLVDPRAAAGTQQVTLNATSRDATASSATAAFTVTPFEMTSIPTGQIGRPRAGRGTGEIAIGGRFPASCEVTFRDPLGQTWSQRRGRTFEGLDKFTLDVPNNAVPGPLQVIAPSGAVLTTTPPLDIVDYRNTHAPNVANSDMGARTNDYTWEDFVATFGNDDTDICFAPHAVAEFFGVADVVCQRDPIAWGHFLVYQGRVEENPGKGLCFGWSTTSRQWLNGTYRFNPRGFNVDYSEGSQNKKAVVRAHISQHDEEFQDALDDGFDRTGAQERDYIKRAINAGRVVAVAFRQGDSGHAVVGYDYRDITTPTGPGLELIIYDPNNPFDNGEATNLGARTAALNASRITLGNDGSWSGSTLNWFGPNNKLSVTEAIPPIGANATLPLSLSVSSFFDTAPGAPPVKVTEIESGGKSILDSSGEPAPDSGVDLRPDLSGAGAQPEWHLEKGREYTFKVAGTGSGTYGHGVVGDGVRAQVEGAKTKAGQIDEITIRPGQAQIGVDSDGAGAVDIALADTVGSATRTANITLSNGRDAEAELSGGVVRVAQAGKPATATVTLATIGSTIPETATTAPIRVGAGQAIELKPKSWSAVSERVNLTVRDKRGRVVKRTTAKLRANKLVSVSGVRAKRSGKRVTVTGSVGKRGKTPVLTALVEQIRGGKVVASKFNGLKGAQVRAGRFSVPVEVGTVRKGTKLRVTVVLNDTSQELATTTKRIELR